MRAYTDAVAQALLAAKAADQFKPLRAWPAPHAACPMRWKAGCAARCRPTAHLAGREPHRRGHPAVTLPESQAAAVARLNDGGQGHLAWISASKIPPEQALSRLSRCTAHRARHVAPSLNQKVNPP